MPKIRTNRSAAKRFKATGSGKVKRSHAYRAPPDVCQDAQAEEKLRHSAIVAAVDTPGVKRLLPYL